jgi:hypothetical protein
MDTLAPVGSLGLPRADAPTPAPIDVGNLQLRRPGMERRQPLQPTGGKRGTFRHFVARASRYRPDIRPMIRNRCTEI